MEAATKPFCGQSQDAFVSRQLTEEGYCVLDDYLPADECKRLQQEITSANESGKMSPGRLAGGRTSGVRSEMVINGAIRSDRIIWIERNESCFAAVGDYIQKLHSLVMGLNKHLGEMCHLNGHTKVIAMPFSQQLFDPASSFISPHELIIKNSLTGYGSLLSSWWVLHNTC